MQTGRMSAMMISGGDDTGDRELSGRGGDQGGLHDALVRPL